jgi:hypothetical protein
MEQTYWLRRQRSALGMARGAQGAASRLIHYDLAGRYAAKAAESAGAPADEGPAELVLPPRIAGTEEAPR